MDNTSLDMPCKKCGDDMWGIRDYSYREVCEACGGNETEYHKGNSFKKVNGRI